MGDLSKNFSRREFRCKCGQCDQVGPDPELILVMQEIRDHFGVLVRVYSGHRCPTYNRRVGGAKYSQHLKGTACDFAVKGVAHDTVQEYLLERYAGKYGIGRYDTFTHVDVRPKMARWDNRS